MPPRLLTLPQPPAVVTDTDCAACDFNVPGKRCLKKMGWVWRGETFAGTRAEYMSIKSQLEAEVVRNKEGKQVPFTDLPADEQSRVLKDRFKGYCQKVYKKGEVLCRGVQER